MRYLIQLALVAALATGLALAQSSSSSSQSQQPSSSSGSQTSPSSSGSQTSPSSTQPDQTQTQPSATQPSTPDKDKDKDAQQGSKMPQGETSAASSTDLESTIQQAIQKDPSLANSNVQVKVTNKEVDLSGTVNSDDEKKTAEQIAKSNAGTRKVKNHIKVKSASSTSPSTSATPK